MLTELVPQFPEETGDAKEDIRALKSYLSGWFRKLNEVDALAIAEQGEWTPTVTAVSGTFTSVSATGKYTRIENQWFLRILITVTTNGTAASAVQVTLPITATERCSLYGRENGSSGNALTGEVQSGSNIASIVNYDNTYPASSGCTLSISMVVV